MSKLYCKEKINNSSRRNAIKSYFYNESPATFSDNECTIFQCGGMKNRSAGDLVMLLDGLFKKETTIEEAIWLLVDMINKRECRALYCPNIQKIVFFSKKSRAYSFNGEFTHRIYTDKSSLGLDGYSWNSMLGIYKTKQNERKNK